MTDNNGWLPFDPQDTQRYQTEASGTDGQGYRALRVVLGDTISGAMAAPSVLLMAKDIDGHDRHLLATDDPQNTGSYQLKVDTEMVAYISGATWVVTNMKVGSQDQTSGTLRYLKTDDDGVLYTYDVPNSGTLLDISGAIVGEFANLSGTLLDTSGGVTYGLTSLSGTLLDISGAIVGEFANMSGTLLDISGGVTYGLTSISGTLLDISGAIVGEFANLSGTLLDTSGGVTYGLTSLSGTLLDISGALVGQITNLSGTLQNTSGGIIYGLTNLSGTLLDISGALIGQITNLSGTLQNTSGGIIYGLTNLSGTLLDLSGALVGQVTNLSGTLQNTSGGIIYELHNISGTLLDMSGAMVGLTPPIERYDDPSSYSGTLQMLLYTGSLPPVGEEDAVPHRGTSDGAAYTAEQFFLNRSDEVTTYGAPMTSYASGTIAIATTETPIVLGSSTDAHLVRVTAFDYNIGMVCLGGSDVGSRNAGRPIEPGESFVTKIGDISKAYINGVYVGDGVTWLIEDV